MSSRRRKRPKKLGSWVAIGQLVAHHRKLKGYTQEQFAEVVKLSVDTIGSIEQGRMPLQFDRAEQFDQVLGTNGTFAFLVSKLALWEKIPLLVQNLGTYEREAIAILTYQAQVVPGLLQTRDYCLATFAARHPALRDQTAEEWVNDRMERQQIWEDEEPPIGHFIIEESILRRQVGGPEVMRAQYRRILELCEPQHMAFQIMPMDRMPHAGLAGPMTLLETFEHHRVVYVEVQTVSFLVDDLDEVSDYHRKYGMLQSQALSPGESVDLLEGLLREL
ncbi:helix-turn-helix transcriptional regulator [Streptomyces roseirectus]|uniref:Helix-turn-helix transcriptional regulator n=1 Tax=Streptomyces roseirectus TaxID=2768066 RepID=A0A7H0IB27_9ACTN|nr:helix-turn-helix transcriptional regulator [Streptomyces roseirectus]QNP69993.1 helix-turn-helix transcriptional regulator [Streptomyces roseirectus]